MRTCINRYKNVGCLKKGCVITFFGFALYEIIALICIFKPWKIIYYQIFDDVDKSKINRYDYRIFYNTEAWPLAKACRSQDTIEIERLVKVIGLNVNYVDSMYGNTLLESAVANEDELSVRTLLRNGADSNCSEVIPDNHSLCLNTTPEIFRRLLQYTDPNCIIPHHGHLISRWAGRNDEFTKILIEVGAEINLNTLEQNEIQPIMKCLLNKHYEMASYLLEHGSWYDERINWQGRNILDILRDDDSNYIGDKVHKQKMNVVGLLQERGVDYWSYPISEEVLERIKKNHPYDWKDYSIKY